MSLQYGQSFNGGLYRLHDAKSGEEADRRVGRSFRHLNGPFRCFGYDWMGCEYALDGSAFVGTEPAIAVFEPATGEVFQVERNFLDFHEIELTEDPESALNVEAFAEWTIAHPETVPLALNTCIGHRHPLCLGGEDTIENMEVVDISVYWSFNRQISDQVDVLTEGTKITGVKDRE